jgi:hypothetical protein|tara:strand:+ start:263 stop:649 length:387 start_codon:yes stop_codon:yes gene_type:complete
MADLGLKAVSLYETFNPIRNLWRNVLIVAIEDAIKMTNLIAKYPEFYGHKRYHSIDYVTLPNSDFVKICEYSDLDHNIVRKKIIETLERIKDGKKDMPAMFGKWLLQSKEGSPVAGKRRNHSSSMSYV